MSVLGEWVVEMFGSAGDLVGGDVVELNPQRDTVDGMTAMVAAKLVRELAARISK